jgi:hypothetical protein
MPLSGIGGASCCVVGALGHVGTERIAAVNNVSMQLLLKSAIVCALEISIAFDERQLRIRLY